MRQGSLLRLPWPSPAGNLFTTHTPVAAGFDRFPPALIAQYLARYAETRLGFSLDALLGLGRQNPSDPSEAFNMAYLAVRGSGAVNGVSRLHGQVSRRLFAALFTRWPMAEVPVGHVTNGVHVPSWDSAEADALWTTACGPERWRGTTDRLEQDIRCASDVKLWELRTTSRQATSAAKSGWCKSRRDVLTLTVFGLAIVVRLAARGSAAKDTGSAAVPWEWRTQSWQGYSAGPPPSWR